MQEQFGGYAQNPGPYLGRPRLREGRLRGAAWR
jgi:hypothetical protein